MSYLQLWHHPVDVHRHRADRNYEERITLASLWLWEKVWTTTLNGTNKFVRDYHAIQPVGVPLAEEEIVILPRWASLDDSSSRDSSSIVTLLLSTRFVDISRQTKFRASAAWLCRARPWQRLLALSRKQVAIIASDDQATRRSRSGQSFRMIAAETKEWHG